MQDTQTQQEKFTYILTSYQSLRETWKQFNAEQERNYNYLIGKILGDDVRADLNANKRPIFEFQTISQFVEYFAGKLKRDLIRMKAVPEGEGDELTSKLNTQVTDWAVGESGYQAISEAATDAVIGKIGCVVLYWSTKNNPEGEFICESVDPFLVLGDPEARAKYDQKDARFIVYQPKLSAEEVIHVYGDGLSDEQIQKIKANAEAIEGTYRTNTTSKSWFARVVNTFSRLFKSKVEGLSDLYDAKDGLYRVIEWHEKRMVSKQVLVSAATNDFEILPDGHEDDPSYLENLKVQTVKTQSGEVVQRFINPQIENISKEITYKISICPALLPDELLQEVPYPAKMQGVGFAIKQLFFRTLHPDRTQTQSLVDRLIAPADFYIQRMMTAMEAAMRGVKPDIIYPDGAITSENINEWESPERGKLKKYFITKSGDKPIEERPPTEVFQMLKVLAEEGKDLHESTSGIGINARGFQESAGESGKLANIRTKNTEVMVVDFLNNVAQTTRQVYKFANRTLKQYMTFQRTIRLLSEDGNPEWIVVNKPYLGKMLNDMSQGEYDFRIDSSITGDSVRKETTAIMMGLKPLVEFDPIISLKVASIISKNQDIPESKELAAIIEERMGMALSAEAKQRGLEDTQNKMALAAQVKTMLTDKTKQKEPV